MLGGSLVVLLAMVATYGSGRLHWALVPIAMCGGMEAPWVVRWLRGRADPLDPKSLVSVFVFHNTFTAALLHLGWDWYTPLVRVPPDPWEWMGRLGVLNVASVFCLEAAYAIGTRVWATPRPPRPLSRARLSAAVVGCATAAVLAETYVWRRFGGPLGMIEAYEARGVEFVGTGWALMLAWPFFLVLFFGWIVRYRVARPLHRSSLVPIVVVFGVFALCHFAWVGLNGSRSSILAGLFLAAGFVHFLVCRLPAHVVRVGMVFLLVFAFFYSFYKGAGRAGIADALTRPGGLSDVQARTGRDVRWLLLGDLARADIQMEVLWTMYDANPRYRLKWGGTYVGAAVFIPRNIWPTRTHGPQEAYAELAQGLSGRVRPGDKAGSRVFGLVGETLLNFGWVGVPLAHVLYGLLIAFVHRLVRGVRLGNAAGFLAPLWIFLTVELYLADLVNVAFMFFQDGAMLILVWTAAVRWGARRPAAVSYASRSSYAAVTAHVA